MSPQPVTILIGALGGEGGGVLGDWLIAAALQEGLPAQKTSVPGVSQRTGATTYYLEIFPEKSATAPVMALVPTPGAIDLMVASELIEAGRAMQNAYITAERTTLIASTHRVYATAEKKVPTDGRYDAAKIIEAAPKLARKAVLFDMLKLAQEAGTVINAVLFGAMAGCGVLPLSREACENAIRNTGKGAEASLRGFAAGYARATSAAPVDGRTVAIESSRKPASSALSARIQAEFPEVLRDVLEEAAARLVDYQDTAYARLYLDRVAEVLAADREAGGEANALLLTRETARLLALWMSYEDVIRVADLKTRASRFERVRREAAPREGQIVVITDYLKPTANEIADILPPFLAAPLRRRAGEGRPMKLPTSTVRGFLAMRALAWLRPLRRKGSRYRHEQILMERWLGAIKYLALAARDVELPLEVAQCARLQRGYGETHRRSREAFLAILDDLADNGQALARGADALKQAIRQARESALLNEACKPDPLPRREQAALYRGA
ncbi:MAG TPA: indolepyruvate oxidoreductase subunit beta family protein [Candidatus Desulfobacillus sp.]|nr:indolepyruvate oxidoreductase subunit beta family protein [Candidatus Desulfobacillus sp.]